jgi:hypothetical protein
MLEESSVSVPLPSLDRVRIEIVWPMQILIPLRESCRVLILKWAPAFAFLSLGATCSV